MTHYSLEEWADFARNPATRESAAEMKSHLEQGCSACSEVLAMWNQVLKAAANEPGFDVPESGVRGAKALFSIARMEPRAQNLPVHVARLVFTSLAEPLLDFRGVETSASHWLFEEGDWVIDLRLRRQADQNLVSVAGQILDRSKSDRVYQSSTVSVVRPKEELTRTNTNEFGEFEFEFGADDDLMLSVGVEDEAVLVLALPGPAARGPGGSAGFH